MSEKKNYLLLDIDGTAAPLDGAAGETVMDGIVVRAPYANWYIPERVAALMYFLDLRKEVPGKNGFVTEMQWATRWANDANNINKELELDHFPYLNVNEDNEEVGEWFKVPALKAFVEEHLAEDNTIVIADDEFTKEFSEWAEKYPNLKLVLTDPDEGITDEQAEEIIGYFF